ncbi:MAG: hypothetical protein ACRDLF_02280 [Solirubrobacteraceae bacterium]
MSIQIGPYTFDRVRHDRDADVLYLAHGEPARAVDFDETPEGHAVSYDAKSKLIGLRLIDVRRLFEEAKGGRVLIELPATADPAELQLAVA